VSAGEDREARSLADEIMPDLILLGLSLALQVGALVLLHHRDSLARAWVRLQASASGQRDRERTDAAVAVFRAELAAWEHEQAGR
jgi:hypothetical protein